MSAVRACHRPPFLPRIVSAGPTIHGHDLNRVAAAWSTAFLAVDQPVPEWHRPMDNAREVRGLDAVWHDLTELETTQKRQPSTPPMLRFEPPARRQPRRQQARRLSPRKVYPGELRRRRRQGRSGLVAERRTGGHLQTCGCLPTSRWQSGDLRAVMYSKNRKAGLAPAFRSSRRESAD